MLNQPADERAQSSLDIEHLLKDVVHKQVADYMRKYAATIERKLGLTKDDLISDMRLQIWKGILTHDKTKTANLKTYLNTIIKNRFLFLYEQSTLKKHNSVDYYADAFNATGADQEHMESEETGETIFEKRQQLAKDLYELPAQDRRLFRDVILGFNMSELTKRNGLTRAEVTAAVNRIDSEIKKRRAGNEE